jgi:hypothetical protein
MKKNILSAVNNILNEINTDSSIIQAVLSDKMKDKNIVVSMTVDNTSYEIWKVKNGYEVVKSSYPKNDNDFKKHLASKEDKESVFKEMIAALAKGLTISDIDINANKSDN